MNMNKSIKPKIIVKNNNNNNIIIDLNVIQKEQYKIELATEICTYITEDFSRFHSLKNNPRNGNFNINTLTKKIIKIINNINATKYNSHQIYYAICKFNQKIDIKAKKEKWYLRGEKWIQSPLYLFYIKDDIQIIDYVKNFLQYK